MWFAEVNVGQRLDPLRMSEIKKALPGVRQEGRCLRIPWHAIEAGFELLPRLCLPVRDVSWWPGPPPDPLSVDAVLNHLLARFSEEVVAGVFPWQIEGLQKAYVLPQLWMHGTGAGKTWASALWAVSGPRYRKRAVDLAIFVTKSSVADQVTADITRHARGAVLPFRLKNKADIRKKDEWQTAEAYVQWCEREGLPGLIVTGWESLVDTRKEFIGLDPTSLVLDEVQHRLRSTEHWNKVQLVSDIERRKEQKEEIEAAGGFFPKGDPNVGIRPAENAVSAAKEIARACERRLELSATPLDRIRDLWSTWSILQPGPPKGASLEGSWTDWADCFCDAKVGQYDQRDTSGVSNIPGLIERYGNLIHIVGTKRIRSRLPGIRRKTVYLDHCDLGPPNPELKQRRIDTWQKEKAKAIADGKEGAENKRLSRLWMIQALTADRKSTGKFLEALREDVAAGHHIVVVTGLREHVDSLGELFLREFPDVPSWAVHGDTAPTRRNKLKLEYIAAPRAAILCGTIDAWGTGTDGLQCTRAVHVLMIPPMPMTIEQLEGRFPRPGQKEITDITYWVARDTPDTRYVNIVFEKSDIQELLGTTGAMDGAKESLTRLDQKIVIQEILQGMARAKNAMAEMFEAVESYDDL